MPFYRCELAANLTAESALARLKAVVGPEPSFPQFFQRALGRDSTARPPFIGQVEADHFRVRRDIWYRNDFRPVITGHVMSVPAGVRVRVTMFLKPATAVFMFIWFSGFAFVGFSALRTPEGTQQALISPVAMLLFGVVLVGCGFVPEAEGEKAPPAGPGAALKGPPYFFSIFTDRNSIRVFGVSPSRGVCSIASTTFMPSTTRAKAV